VGRNFHGNPYTFLLQKQTLVLKIRIEFPLGLVVGVRNIVSRHCPFSCYLTNLSHGIFPFGVAKVKNFSGMQSLASIFFILVRAVPALAFAAVSSI
jgi:hypothetical protein